MSVAAGFVHLAQSGSSACRPGPASRSALDVVLFILAVMAGRVIPMFTNNGVPGAQRDPQAVRREGCARAGAGTARRRRGRARGRAAGHRGRWLASRTRFAGGSGSPGRRSKVPLVWVLHLAYLWVPVHLALRALAGLGVVAPSLRRMP